MNQYLISNELAVSNRRLFYSMATIAEMLRRFKSVDSGQAAIDVLTASTDDLVSLNLEQMYDGKTNKGVDIRPSYFEDPYFKTYEQAAAYSDWKDKITPNHRRNPGTPNLYINGFFYRSVFAQMRGDSIFFGSSWTEGNDIEQDFKDIYGLGGQHRVIFVNDYLRPQFNKYIEQITGLKMK
jgi:hypothetical protein